MIYDLDLTAICNSVEDEDEDEDGFMLFLIGG